MTNDATDPTELLILRLLNEHSSRSSLSPADVARALEPGPAWRARLPQARRAAVRLARAGSVVILRKGKPVDPDDFKGVYRIALPPSG